MNYKTYTYSDVHDMHYGDDYVIEPISKYGDCGFTINWTEEDFDPYEDEEPDTDQKMICTVFDALEIVQEVQREINGPDFDVMNFDTDILCMLDRWALESCGLWLGDMPFFYIDINIKGGIPKAHMNTSPDANDPDPDDSPEMAFRKTWESVINVDAINNMDKETLEQVSDILDKIK